LGPAQCGPGKEKDMATKRPAFGGYTINFAGCTDSLESVFGTQPITPAEMTKKIWEYVKTHNLSK
jgi:hypothetical protein